MRTKTLIATTAAGLAGALAVGVVGPADAGTRTRQPITEQNCTTDGQIRVRVTFRRAFEGSVTLERYDNEPLTAEHYESSPASAGGLPTRNLYVNPAEVVESRWVDVDVHDDQGRQVGEKALELIECP